MVDGLNPSKKRTHLSANKSFESQSQTKIVVRHLPPTLTSEQFLEIVGPLPEQDYYRFCKPDPSLGQQSSFSRAYLNIVQAQDLIVFTEKFQGYVFLDKNGTEYPCLVEYAPNQLNPKSDRQTRKDPKVNSIDQDPEYQSFVAAMNAPLAGADLLPNPELMLEEIEKKQRDIHDSKSKSGVTSTPLLDFLKRKREEKKQKKQGSHQAVLSRPNKVQQARSNDDGRPTTGKSHFDDEFHAPSRFAAGDRPNRKQHRSFDKAEFRPSVKDQKRSNNVDQGSSAVHKEQKPKGKASAGSQDKEAKTNPPSTFPSVNEPTSKGERRPAESNSSKVEQSSTEERENPARLVLPSTNSKTSKTRPSMQIYNPGERVRLRREQNPSS